MTYKFLPNKHNHYLNDYNKYYNELIDNYNRWNENNFEYKYFLKLIPFIIKYNNLVIINYEKEKHHNKSLYNFINDFIDFINLFTDLINTKEIKSIIVMNNPSLKICDDYPQLYDILQKYEITFNK